MNHTVLKFLNTTLILAQLLMNTERVTFYESYCTEVLKYHFETYVTRSQGLDTIW